MSTGKGLNHKSTGKGLNHMSTVKGLNHKSNGKGLNHMSTGKGLNHKSNGKGLNIVVFSIKMSHSIQHASPKCYQRMNGCHLSRMTKGINMPSNSWTGSRPEIFLHET